MAGGVGCAQIREHRSTLAPGGIGIRTRGMHDGADGGPQPNHPRPACDASESPRLRRRPINLSPGSQRANCEDQTTSPVAQSASNHLWDADVTSQHSLNSPQKLGGRSSVVQLPFGQCARVNPELSCQPLLRDAVLRPIPDESLAKGVRGLLWISADGAELHRVEIQAFTLEDAEHACEMFALGHADALFPPRQSLLIDVQPTGKCPLRHASASSVSLQRFTDGRWLRSRVISKESDD